MAARRTSLCLAARAGGAALLTLALAFAPVLMLACPRAMAADAPLRPLKVVTFALVPFGMLDAAGMPAGVTVDLQQQLALESGLAMENLIVPYPRAVAMIISGEADLLLSFDNAKLRAHARQLGAVASGEIVVMGRAGSSYASLADLRGKTVGHIRGAEYDVVLQSDPAVAKHETVSYEQSVRMLLEGRFDATLGVRLSLLHTLRQLGVPRAKLGPELVLGRRDIVVHYSSKRYDPQVAAALTRALAVMRQRGAAAAAMKPYEDGSAR